MSRQPIQHRAAPAPTPDASGSNAAEVRPRIGKPSRRIDRAITSVSASLDITDAAVGQRRFLPRHCACGGACPRCSAEMRGRTDNEANGHQERVADEVASAMNVRTARTARQSASESQLPPGIGSAVDSHSRAAVDTGQEIDARTLAPFESHLGARLSGTRVHTGAKAALAAHAVHARAYTIGHHIVFGAGQYAPETDQGRWLLAHELTHVVQQALSGKSRPQRAPETPVAEPATPVDAELQADLLTWAALQQPPLKLDPASDEYALALRSYYGQLAQPDGALIAKFKTAHTIARMILEARGGNERIGWAGQIGQDLASAGFVADALDIADRLPPDRQVFVLGDLMAHPASLTIEQVSKFSGLIAAAATTPVDNSVLRRLIGDKGQYAVSMGAEKLVAALEPTLDRYKGDATYLDAITEILLYAPQYRVAVSDWLWNVDREYLFSILNSSTFEDPDYADTSSSHDKGTPQPRLSMDVDMPWVYTYKQRYYVDHLIGVAAQHSIAIPPPTDLKFATVRDWLDAYTNDIGRALSMQYAADPQQIAQAYEQIADIFFFHVDEPEKVRLSNTSGRIAGLQPGKPAKMRMRADCDIFATYCMRLMSSGGFEPLAYLGIAPTADGAHVAALLRRDGVYFIASNIHLQPYGAQTEEDARKGLLTEALKVYDGANPKSRYRVYFDASLPDGSMSDAFFADILAYEKDPIHPGVETTRAKDLEMNGP